MSSGARSERLSLTTTPKRQLSKAVRLALEIELPLTSANVELVAKELEPIAQVIAERLRVRSDASLRCSVLGVLVAMEFTNSQRHATADILQFVRQANQFDEAMLERLSMPYWRVLGSYDRFWRLFTRIANALGEGWDHLDSENGDVIRIDKEWYQWEVGLCSVRRFERGRSDLVLDDMSVESPRRFAGRRRVPSKGGSKASDIPVDIEDEDELEAVRNRKKPAKGEWLPRAYTKEGRALWTTDDGATSSYRTPTLRNDKEKYSGRMLVTATTVPVITKTDGVTYAAKGPRVPQFAVGSLVPAGSPRSAVAKRLLERGIRDGLCKNSAVVDRGYPIHGVAKLQKFMWQNNRHLTFDLKSDQRSASELNDDAIVVDGAPFSRDMPENLRQPPRVPMSASPEELKRFQQPFIERAKYRYGCHRAPWAKGSDGTSRWIHPLENGTIAEDELLKAVEPTEYVAPSEMSDGEDSGSAEPNKPYAKTFLAGVNTLPYVQSTLWQTPAWSDDNGRRNLAETTNSQLRGGFVTFDKDYATTVNYVKLAMIVAHSISGLNRSIAKSWIEIEDKLDRRRRARQRGHLPRLSDLAA